MSVRSNPYIETNGLVFCYDMSNTQKSWRGKPTTNVVSSASSMTGWSNYYRTLASSTFITEFGTTGYQFINQPSWNGIARGISIPSTGTYTFSAWFRYFGGSAANNGAAVYISGWGGGDSAVSLDKSKIGVWQRISITLNCTNTSMTFYIISYGGTDNGTGNPDFSSWEVTMPQAEQGTFATPFVDGSRSNTQALLDLTNINTITATSLTYNSNGNFSFVNSADVIDIPSTSLLNLTSVNFSIELWVYIDPSVDTSGVYHGLVEIGSAGSTFLLGIWRSGLFPGCLYNTFGGATMFGTDGSGGYLGANYKLSGSWNHVVFTRNGATSFFYLNGNTWATRSTPSIPNASNNLKIGSSPSAGTFPGIIPVFRFYNGRALTAAEVRQNFYAHKGRYRP